MRQSEVSESKARKTETKQIRQKREEEQEEERGKPRIGRHCKKENTHKEKKKRNTGKKRREKTKKHRSKKDGIKYKTQELEVSEKDPVAQHIQHKQKDKESVHGGALKEDMKVKCRTYGGREYK